MTSARDFGKRMLVMASDVMIPTAMIAGPRSEIPAAATMIVRTQDILLDSRPTALQNAMMPRANRGKYFATNSGAGMAMALRQSAPSEAYRRARDSLATSG